MEERNGMLSILIPKLSDLAHCTPLHRQPATLSHSISHECTTAAATKSSPQIPFCSPACSLIFSSPRLVSSRQPARTSIAITSCFFLVHPVQIEPCGCILGEVRWNRNSYFSWRYGLPTFYFPKHFFNIFRSSMQLRHSNAVNTHNADEVR